MLMTHVFRSSSHLLSLLSPKYSQKTNPALPSAIEKVSRLLFKMSSYLKDKMRHATWYSPCRAPSCNQNLRYSGHNKLCLRAREGYLHANITKYLNPVPSQTRNCPETSLFNSLSLGHRCLPTGLLNETPMVPHLHPS